jgi:hypothetical protein
MRSSIIRIGLLIFLLNAWDSMGATNVVTLGSDLQAAINAASSGDTMVVQSGVYGGNLNFNKPLTVVCSSGNSVSLSGNTTVSGPGLVGFSQTTFLGTLQIATNATAVLSFCSCSAGVTGSGGVLQAFDGQFQTLTMNSGKGTVKRCSFSGDINLVNCPFEALRLNTGGNIYGTAPVGSGLRFVVAQSSFHEVSLTGYTVMMGYNSGFELTDSISLIQLTDCTSTLIGNILSTYTEQGTVAAIHLVRGTIQAYCNRLDNDGDNWAQNGIDCCGLWLESASGQIVNNSITVSIYAAYGLPDADIGIYASGGTGPIVTRGNAIVLYRGNDSGNPVSTATVDADNRQVTECSYSCLTADVGPSLIGVNGANDIFVNPQLNNAYRDPSFGLSPTNTYLLPNTGSPCLNAGPPQAIYNNTDGTRNTIGYTGGPYWNPANYTNNNPIVFWLNTTNQTVLKGTQSTIPINVGASAGH